MIRESIEKAVNKIDLSSKEMEKVFEEIMGGMATPSQIGSFLTALRLKGESVTEITAAAKVMRKKSLRINLSKDINLGTEPLVDTCGTGGTKINTFNISTCSAFVVAGCQVKVAKHGNRSASSSCGSADVLEELGININIPPQKVSESIKKVGIGFLYAPLFHSAMKYAAPVRKEIGIRTIFNVLGPLSNPAGANTQIIGVYEETLVDKLILVLKNLGTRRAFVVCGSDSLDEITITGPTKVAELKSGKIWKYILAPANFGVKKAGLKDIKGGNAKTNAAIIRKILKGEHSARRDIVLMNSSCALVASGVSKNFKEGSSIAANSIDSGRALSKLNELVDFTRGCLR